MTAFVPTTTVQVQRASLVADEFGDERADTAPIATGVPAAVVERRQRAYQPDDERAGVVETFTVRLRPDADVVEGDRLVDERTGAVYQVRDVFSPQSPVLAADVRVSAVRVAAESQLVNS